MKPAGKRFEVQLFGYLLFLFLTMFVCTSTAGAQTAGSFTATGNMTRPRTGHTATLLYDGRVLIAGGHSYIPWIGPAKIRPCSRCVTDSLGTTELYDPSTGIFKSIANMITPRAEHSATLLADGRVLIAGGIDSQGGSLASAEIYDPSTATFTETGSMSIARAGHTATLLNSGKVLIAGGGSPYASAEVYDPATGVFTATGDMTVARGWPQATLLPDGKVFIAPGDDGDDFDSAELFDPEGGTFSRTGWLDFRVFQNRFIPGDVAGVVALLANGNVLVTLQYYGGGGVRTTAVYDVSAGTLMPATDMIYSRYSPGATALPDGTVLISGGYGLCTVSASAEIYDADGSSVTGDMITGRYSHTTTLLNDGRVLIAGGRDSGCGGPALASAELYVPSALAPVPVVTGLRFDRSSVATGSSYSINFSGPSLTDEMFFDVRFTAPGSNDSVVVLNWQTGLVANHRVPVSTTSGTWTINGVRAHNIETDHNGNFVPVSATITVSP
jgi:Galactose oxidase, central domain